MYSILTNREREVYELLIRNHSTREIARLLGANPATISTRLRRGRAQLKTLLEQEGYR